MRIRHADCTRDITGDGQATNLSTSETLACCTGAVAARDVFKKVQRLYLHASSCS